MHKLSYHGPVTALALALVLAVGCENQVTQPSLRREPGSTPGAERAPFKSVIALEPLPGSTGDYSAAYAINDLGQVVGESSAGTSRHAVIWDNSRIPQDLGTLPGQTLSSASAISNDGSVIAGVSYDGTPRPVRWLKSNGQWLIYPLPGATDCSIGGVSSDGTAIAGTCNGLAIVWLNGSRIVLGAGAATGVNSKGQAVGANVAFDHALLWNYSFTSTTVQDLGNLGGTFAAAININDAGEVTGWSEGSDHISHAFLWTPKKGTMTAIGPPGMTSGGYSINASGQVVGDMFPSVQHGGFYDHGKVVDLGVLPGYLSAIAHGLNNNGEAVGFSSGIVFQTRATKWVLK